MIVQTKKRILITLDEEDAEEFLDDPSEVQQKVRALLRAPNGNLDATTPAALRATMSRAAPSPALTRADALKKVMAEKRARQTKTKRRAPEPVTCDRCGEQMDPRGMHGHLRKHEQETEPTAA